eukprot:Phypoly_transcript_15696.p1 GENE.Phypoly_transcript_15696~~Phypoly_transcript_15696.p1  ORF type:complete len:234 (+),score=24.92 Phypoly_transcript_15696:153-854(+)
MSVIPKVIMRANHKNKFVVFLIRHGESEANIRAEYISGRSNHVNLTDLGTKQATALGKFFKSNNINFKKAYSSTAVRTLCTAKACLAAMESNLVVEPHEALLEIEMGDFVGRERTSVYTEELIKQINLDAWNFSPPNGESPRQVEERMVQFFEDVIFPQVPQEPTNEIPKFAIFGHGYAFKCLIRHIENMVPSETFKIPIMNTSVTELVFSDDIKILRKNDTEHLVFHQIQIT